MPKAGVFQSAEMERAFATLEDSIMDLIRQVEEILPDTVLRQHHVKTNTSPAPWLEIYHQYLVSQDREAETLALLSLRVMLANFATQIAGQKQELANVAKPIGSLALAKVKRTA